MGRKLSQKDKEYLLSLKREDITFSLLLSLFASRSVVENGKFKIIPPRMKTSDEFDLNPGEYFNTTKVTTNAGLFIYNKLIVEEKFQKVLGYINTPLNSAAVNKIEDKLAKALLNDEIDVPSMVDYLNRTQWLGMQFHSVISGSFTMGTLKPHPKVIKRRDELIKENKDKLKKGDVITAVKIEKELLDVAAKELEGDHGLDLYKSGARGSFDNNFKNISVMKGPVFNPSTGEFDIVETNLMEGIKKEDLPVYANAIITGAYPKAIGTAVSGYFSKQIIAALQAVVLDKPGSDCGSKGYMTVLLTDKNINDFLYRYIIQNGKLVLLDESNMNKFVGQIVKMRSPLYCVSKKLCRVCAGAMYDKLKIDNIGLTAARVSSSLLNLSMKKFHNSTAKITEVKPETLIL
jgi:hypothetical protein